MIFQAAGRNTLAVQRLMGEEKARECKRFLPVLTPPPSLAFCSHPTLRVNDDFDSFSATVFSSRKSLNIHGITHHMNGYYCANVMSFLFWNSWSRRHFRLWEHEVGLDETSGIKLPCWNVVVLFFGSQLKKGRRFLLPRKRLACHLHKLKDPQNMIIRLQISWKLQAVWINSSSIETHFLVWCYRGRKQRLTKSTTARTSVICKCNFAFLLSFLGYS